MAIRREFFGKKDANEIFAYTLSNESGNRARIMTLGGALVNFWVKNKDGSETDIVTGFDNAEDYQKTSGAPGALVGRVANRIKNASFELDGITYSLYANDGAHTLHSGKEGYHKKIWGCLPVDGKEPSLKLHYLSPDGEEAFPGNLDVYVTYTLKENGALEIHYSAETDKATPVNMTNHSYFNLSGVKGNLNNDVELWLDCDRITEVDKELIPTGNNVDIKNTAYDFQSPKPLGDGYGSSDEMLKYCGGYDVNYVVKDYNGRLKLIAVAIDRKAGKTLKVYTDQPCVQLYTANMIKESDPPFKGGINQYKHCAFCLETQAMPDSVHHSDFTDVILRPGHRYDTVTIYECDNL